MVSIACTIIICLAAIAFLFFGVVLYEEKKTLEDRNKRIVNLSKYYDLSLKWIENEIDGRRLKESLMKNGYHRVAIYGMGKWGMILLDTLASTDISVLYGIDIKAREIYCSIPVFTPEEASDDVDAIIVTTLGCYEQVKTMLSKKLKKPIISIEHLVSTFNYDMNYKEKE